MGIKKFAVLVMALIMCLTAVSAMAATNKVEMTIGTDVYLCENLREVFDSPEYIAATGNVSIKLLADTALDISDVSNGYPMVYSGQNVTILLNGKKMTMESGTRWTPFELEGNLTIKGKGALEITETTPCGFWVGENATLRMEAVNCNVESDQIFAVAPNGNAEMQFLGGSYDIGASYIGMDDTGKVQMSADVYDSLINNIDVPDDGLEILPSLSMVEKTPSWVQGPIDMPETGDNTSLLLWSGLLALAAAGFVASRKVRFN